MIWIITWPHIVLAWHRILNKSKLIKINFSVEPFRFSFGDLLTSDGATGYNGYIRFITDGWCIQTDGKASELQMWWWEVKGRIRMFRQITTQLWYLNFLIFIGRYFPSIKPLKQKSILGKILHYPLKLWK